MEIIVLGLLMIQKSTIYEMKKVIEINLTNISSNSIGSIQAAIKKLLSNNMICFSEYVEKSVNKKVYEITDAGKEYFLSSISKPMLYKEKSMELSKFFFMGFTDENKQIELINDYIMELEKELSDLENVNSLLNPRFKFNQTYITSLIEKGGAVEFMTEQKVQSIATFQYATLDLGIDKIKFEIEWFKRFKEKLEMENVRNGE